MKPRVCQNCLYWAYILREQERMRRGQEHTCDLGVLRAPEASDTCDAFELFDYSPRERPDETR